MASAERTYVDPSALLKLYIHEPESAPMNAWRARVKGALPITLHGRWRSRTASPWAAFRKAITTGAMADALLSFEEDLAEGRYAEIDVLWRATLRRAADISRTYTAKLGCRSLDVLHVATALELGWRDFVTFDARQRQVARAIGLKSLTPRT